MTHASFCNSWSSLAAIWMGARYSGVGLGLWGAVGLLVLVVGFGVTPTSPPIDVMLIILAVIMAASVMDAAGGIDFWCGWPSESSAPTRSTSPSSRR
jgi:anaerobic C4-dicarboxylate transporter